MTEYYTSFKYNNQIIIVALTPTDDTIYNKPDNIVDIKNATYNGGPFIAKYIRSFLNYDNKLTNVYIDAAIDEFNNEYVINKIITNKGKLATIKYYITADRALNEYIAKLNAENKRYFTNGAIKEIFNTNNKKKYHGEVKTFDEKQIIKYIINYNNNVFHGDCYIYKNNKVYKKFSFIHGKKQPKYIKYINDTPQFIDTNNNDIYGIDEFDIHGKFNYYNIECRQSDNMCLIN